MEVLTASVRSLEHFLYALHVESDIIPSPFNILKEWGKNGLAQPQHDFVYKTEGLTRIPHEDLDLEKKWTEFDISHELTDIGMERFSADWNALLK